MVDPSRDCQALAYEPPVGECSGGSRKTWQPGMLGRRCYAALPDGETCAGVFGGEQP